MTPLQRPMNASVGFCSSNLTKRSGEECWFFVREQLPLTAFFARRFLRRMIHKEIGALNWDDVIDNTLCCGTVTA
jgi:hypothetical protein